MADNKPHRITSTDSGANSIKPQTTSELLKERDLATFVTTHSPSFLPQTNTSLVSDTKGSSNSFSSKIGFPSKEKSSLKSTVSQSTTSSSNNATMDNNRTSENKDPKPSTGWAPPGTSTFLTGSNPFNKPSANTTSGASNPSTIKSSTPGTGFSQPSSIKPPVTTNILGSNGSGNNVSSSSAPKPSGAGLSQSMSSNSMNSAAAGIKPTTHSIVKPVQEASKGNMTPKVVSSISGSNPSASSQNIKSDKPLGGSDKSALPSSSANGSTTKPSGFPSFGTKSSAPIASVSSTVKPSVPSSGLKNSVPVTSQPSSIKSSLPSTATNPRVPVATAPPTKTKPAVEPTMPGATIPPASTKPVVSDVHSATKPITATNQAPSSKPIPSISVQSTQTSKGNPSVGNTSTKTTISPSKPLAERKHDVLKESPKKEGVTKNFVNDTSSHATSSIPGNAIKRNLSGTIKSSEVNVGGLSKPLTSDKKEIPKKDGVTKDIVKDASSDSTSVPGNDIKRNLSGTTKSSEADVGGLSKTLSTDKKEIPKKDGVTKDIVKDASDSNSVPGNDIKRNLSDTTKSSEADVGKFKKPSTSTNKDSDSSKKIKTNEESKNNASPKNAGKKNSVSFSGSKEASSAAETKKDTKDNSNDIKSGSKRSSNEISKKSESKKPATAKKPKAGSQIEVASRKDAVGEIFICGKGSSQLGLSNKGSDLKEPTRLENMPSNVVDICSGPNHNIALTSNGDVYTWGENSKGALGRDGSTFKPSKVSFEESVEIVQIAAGNSFSAGLDASGKIYAWGTFLSDDEVLGFFESPGKVQKTPMRIGDKLPKGTEFSQIVAGKDHMLLLSTKGRVYAIGDMKYGQLGVRMLRQRDGDDIPQGLRLNCLSLKNIVQIAAGGYHSFAVDKKDVIFSWGQNNYYQCGFSSSSPNYDATIELPTKCGSIMDLGQCTLYAGENHTLALNEEGELYGFGLAQDGLIGVSMEKTTFSDVDGKKALEEPEHILFPNSTEVELVAVGSKHSFAYAGSKLYSWGPEASASGHSGSSSIPKEVTTFGSEKILTMAAGKQHSMFLVADSNSMQ